MSSDVTGTQQQQQQQQELNNNNNWPRESTKKGATDDGRVLGPACAPGHTYPNVA